MIVILIKPYILLKISRSQEAEYLVHTHVLSWDKKGQNSANSHCLSLSTARVKTINTFTLGGVAMGSVSRNASVFT